MPDRELVRRRAAGEPLRSLAADYGVAHTTLGRYFARPEVMSELRRQARGLRAEQRAARREERQLREQAKTQTALARARARQAAAYAQLPRRSDSQAALLDEHDRRLPLLRADLHSPNDHAAARAVADGGGLQAVIEATGLRTRKNVLTLIDPAILVRAFDNDAADRTSLAERARLRRLVPDRELVKRRAAGEPLRRIAADYHVAHTTLSRWFARPEIARRLARKQASPPAHARPSRAATEQKHADRAHTRSRHPVDSAPSLSAQLAHHERTGDP